MRGVEGSRALLLAALLACACGTAPPAEAPAPEPWIPLFDGRDLAGWVVKIAGRELGDDPLRTFRAEDGVLRVCYDGYESFEGRFGHLFYRAPFERYR